MLFNSHIFVFVFLPITLAGFFALRNLRSSQPVRLWLLGASIVFYAWWSLPLTALLAASIGFNFLAGRLITAIRDSYPGRARMVMIAGVVLNLAPIVYYKYSVFFLKNLTALTSLDFAVYTAVLPLAISFYTFIQIAYLVDAQKGKAIYYSFLDYALFVTFFPHLIAGPIVHHHGLIPQITAIGRGRDLSLDIATGLIFFVMGLAKKVILADPISDLADPVFERAAAHPPGFVDAWVAVSAFALGIYFDFSGYSDMAVGLARMFGIRLPYNFSSPYKATSIIDFWRRWHMTLSQFLRDYVYIPLGGNRRGPARRYVNLMLTMLIGGLWHGASWTFVIWGGLHGLYLVVNRAWSAVAGARGIVLSGPLARTITLLAVAVAWVFFASPGFDHALGMLGGLAGMYGPLSPDVSAAVADSVLGMGLLETVARHGRFHLLSQLMPFVLLAIGAATALFAPNSQEVIDRHDSNTASLATLLGRIVWRPSSAIALSLVFVACVLLMSDVREFVYFQF